MSYHEPIVPPAELLSVLGLSAGAPPDGILRAFLSHQRVCHPDSGGTVGDWLNGCWAYQAALAGEAYARDPHAWVRAHPRPAQLGDWRAVAIEEVCRHLPSVFEALEATRDYQTARWAQVISMRMAEVEVWREFLPEVWDLGTLRWTTGRPPPLLAVQADIAALVRLPELLHLTEAAFQVVFHVKPKKKANNVTLGSLKALSSTERGTWATQPAPHFRLQLWWGWWAAMATWVSPRGYAEQRARLVHHELMHGYVKEVKGQLVGKMRGHDIEEFGATLERYGALDMPTAHLLRTGAAHPRTSQLDEEVQGDRSWLQPIRTVETATNAQVHTTEAWERQLLELRDELELALEEVLDTDVGYLPADELAAKIAALAKVQAVRSADLADLEHVRRMLRRYRPVRST